MSTESARVDEHEESASLADMLGESFDALEGIEGEPKEEAKEPAADLDEPEGEEPEGEADPGNEPDEVPEDEPGEAIEPPEHWSEGDRETFSSLPKEGQEFLLRRHREMEADYTRKTSEIAPIRKALEPFRPAMEQYGLNEAQAIGTITQAAQQFWNYQNQLQTQPQEAIRAIAAQFGIELEGDAYADPDLKSLRQELNETKQQLAQFQQSQFQTQQQSLQSQIEEFAKDHPHFETLRAEMGALMQAGRAKGLEEAYEMAKWANPETRQKILDEQKAEAKKKAEAERKAKADKAKKASVGVRSKETSGETHEPESMGAALREAWDEHSN